MNPECSKVSHSESVNVTREHIDEKYLGFMLIFNNFKVSE